MINKYVTINDTIITQIFDDINSKDLIRKNSYFYSEAKKRCRKANYFVFLPIIELKKYCRKEYVFYGSILTVLAYFWDRIIDSDIKDSHSVSTSTAICNYLIQRYTFWICKKNFKSNNIFSEFMYKQGKYTIYEKKWNECQEYIYKYFDKELIYQKTNLLLYSCNIPNDDTTTTEIMKLYSNIILLADDIFDFEEDIEKKTLTYPIILYYFLKKKLPTNNYDKKTYYQVFDNVKNILLKMINTLENKIQQTNKRSNIIQINIQEIKNNLIKKAF